MTCAFLLRSGGRSLCLVGRGSGLRHDVPISSQVTARFCQRAYSDAVHDHFSTPRNVGSLDSKDPCVGTAIVGKASCGDVIKLQVKIQNGIIEDVKFKTFGCGSAIASTSYASQLIKGKTCADALNIKNVDIAKELNLPPVKIHCSLLAEDAIKHAIKDYRKKQADKTFSPQEAILDE